MREDVARRACACDYGSDDFRLARAVQRPTGMNSHATQVEASLYTYMIRSHRCLESLYLQVLDAMTVSAPNLGELWTTLDRELRAHMETEERFVLPAFARVDRDEALAVLRDHGFFREQLLELGVAIDLHLIRFERSRDFVDRLRVHASREERLLYRWADQHLGVPAIEAALAFAAGS